jgi:TorA maturation chaperone TorD
MLENSQRQDLCRFFAGAFNYPDLALVANLAEEVAKVASLLAVDHPQFEPFPSLAELEVSYTELFISRVGGVPAPPYGSVYLEPEKQLMGQTTLCALRAYQGEGLSHGEGGDPPDFISTELEFLYYLIGQEMTAVAQGRLEDARILRQKQADFANTLLLPWVDQFCTRINEAAGVAAFYHWSADMLKEFANRTDGLSIGS